LTTWWTPLREDTTMIAIAGLMLFVGMTCVLVWGGFTQDRAAQRSRSGRASR
jgi:hypothetical protein